MSRGSVLWHQSDWTPQLRMADICIVTPGQLGSNPRVVKEADALSADGHKVHVIATRVMDLVEARDQAILSTAAWGVTRVSFDTALTRWPERLLQIGARRLFTVTQSASLAGVAHSAMARKLTQAALARPADLYIAHYVAALPAVARAARRFRAQYAYDAEDFHLGDLPDYKKHDRERTLIRAVESHYLDGAAFVTAASPGIADAYASAYKITRPAVLLNVFPKKNAPMPSAGDRRVAERPSVYWFSQTIGPGRGLECALEAIARARSRPHLHLRGAPAAGFEELLRATARRLGVEDRLHLLPPAAPQDMERLAAQHDLGLVSETGETRSRRIALTNKQFTYLLAGIPVAMSDIPAHAEFAAEASGAAFIFRSNDATSLAQVLDNLLCDTSRLAKARASAFALGSSRFNWDREQETLLSLVSEVVRCV